jgi:hypothetical protein
MSRPIIVGVVLGLAALAWMASDGRFGRRCGRPRNTQMVMHHIAEALVHYQVDHSNACPTSIQELVDGHYLNRLPRDTWGQPLAFRCPGEHAPDGADVSSAGPDRRFGTADDLRSWDP